MRFIKTDCEIINLEHIKYFQIICNDYGNYEVEARLSSGEGYCLFESNLEKYAEIYFNNLAYYLKGENRILYLKDVDCETTRDIIYYEKRLEEDRNGGEKEHVKA